MYKQILLMLLLSICSPLSGCTQSPEVSRESVALLATNSAPAEQVDLSRFFPGAEGTFVLLDAQTGRSLRYNPERAQKRFTPASTFKIPNSLIALETGVANGPDFLLAYKSFGSAPQQWWPKAWSQDQTLRTAIRDSVLWYYQELARRIGPERMRKYVQQFGYGNRDISGKIDRFWLNGGLEISPDEQVDFLRRFYFGKLGVSERSTKILKDILVLKETPEYRLSGKTGTAELTATKELGWLVGYVERGDAVYFYALNMEGERVWEDWPPSKRLELVGAILQELGVLSQPVSASSARAAS